MKFRTAILIFVFFSASFFVAASSYADGPNLKNQIKGQLNTGAESSGLKLEGEEAPDVRIVGSGLINTLLGAYGIIFTLLMVNAGHLLITAHGNQEMIDKAYKTIAGAIIGLILVLTSYSIAYFVGKSLTKVTRYGETPVNVNYK